QGGYGVRVDVRAGKIAQDFAHAISQLPGHEVSAVVSRSKGRAAEFASRFCDAGAAIYESVEELGGVDAVYVATPPEQHLACSVALLERRLPVLCEKPLATTARDVEHLIATARKHRTFLMEGMWTRCFPATMKARELIDSDAIGKVVGVQAEFGYDVANGCPASVRGDPETGGMTYDIGIYLAEKGLLAFPSADYACARATAAAVYGDEDGVDLSVAASLRFQRKGAADETTAGVASLMWTGIADTPETATILGTRGAIIFEAAAHVPSSLLLRERVTRTHSREKRFDFLPPRDNGHHRWNYPGSICLQYEAMAVERALLAGAIEAREWTFDDCASAHRIIHQVKADLRRNQPHAGASDWPR
ncbi:hypothetical protein CTAYLR_007849, partial [Chrysophaeum taylorii]